MSLLQIVKELDKDYKIRSLYFLKSCTHSIAVVLGLSSQVN